MFDGEGKTRQSGGFGQAASIASRSSSSKLHGPNAHIGILPDTDQPVVRKPRDPIDCAHCVGLSNDDWVLPTLLHVPHHDVRVKRTSGHISA